MVPDPIGPLGFGRKPGQNGRLVRGGNVTRNRLKQHQGVGIGEVQRKVQYSVFAQLPSRQAGDAIHMRVRSRHAQVHMVLRVTFVRDPEHAHTFDLAPWQQPLSFSAEPHRFDAQIRRVPQHLPCTSAAGDCTDSKDIRPQGSVFPEER